LRKLASSRCGMRVLFFGCLRIIAAQTRVRYAKRFELHSLAVCLPRLGLSRATVQTRIKSGQITPRLPL
jgi:hypothetical protein